MRWVVEMKSDDLKNRAKNLETESFYSLLEAVIDLSDTLGSVSPPKRKAWISHIVEEIHNKQGGKCAICGRKLEYGSHEVDHVIPHSFGGGNEKGNLQLACRSCNRSKRNSVDPGALLDYLEDKAANL